MSSDLIIILVSRVENNPKMIEVHATGARGKKIEWTVTFVVDNKIGFGYQYVPETGYQAEHLIPFEIKQAARKEYESASD